MDDDVSCRLEAEEHMMDLTVVLAHSSEPFKVCFCLWATKNSVFLRTFSYLYAQILLLVGSGAHMGYRELTNSVWLCARQLPSPLY